MPCGEAGVGEGRLGRQSSAEPERDRQALEFGDLHRPAIVRLYKSEVGAVVVLIRLV